MTGRREVLDDARLDAVLDAVALPPPGAGDTAHRHAVLHDVARHHPVWVARLAEGHADAIAILAEAGCQPVPGARYGVWASRGDLRHDPVAGTASGTKPFCSGLGILDRALVTADGPHGQVLLDLSVVEGPTATADTSGWHTSALAASRTGSLRLDGHPVDGVVGAPGWYLDRPGFWHGACGPAACWAGATAAVADTAESLAGGDDPHRLAHLGALRAATWAVQALLTAAGAEIDAAPDDRALAERRAQSLRHVVERLCTDALDRFGRALGPRPYVGDAATAQRVADIHLYLRQHHAERDLESLGRLPGQSAP